MLKLGLSPSNTLWGIKLSGQFACFRSSTVYPIANASGWAKKLAISSLCASMSSLWDLQNPINSAGITLP